MSVRSRPPFADSHDSCSPVADVAAYGCDDEGGAEGGAEANDKPADDNDKGASNDKGDLAALLEAVSGLTAEVAALKAQRGSDETPDAADESTDDGADEAKSEIFKRMEKKLLEQDAALTAARARARADYLKSIGLDGDYADLAPEFDPFTDAGRRSAADWLENRPKLKASQSSADPKAERLRTLEEVLGDKPGAKMIDLTEWDTARQNAAKIGR